jgi:DNA repair protein SbcC/Rad50
VARALRAAGRRPPREARIKSNLSATRRDLDELHGGVALVDSVITGSRRSERDLVRGFFSEIQPLMNALYGRLRPHPVLDRLRLDVGSFDERGEVRFIAYSPTAAANVTNIFSSARLNAVAVCVFLAMNLGVAQSRGMFALLGDPIQNMDDFNVLGLLVPSCAD